LGSVRRRVPITIVVLLWLACADSEARVAWRLSDDRRDAARGRERGRATSSFTSRFSRVVADGFQSRAPEIEISNPRPCTPLTSNAVRARMPDRLPGCWARIEGAVLFANGFLF
jgi:hypothetical protein